MKMKVPADCAAVSYGGKEYTPNKNGVVDVPEEAVSELKEHGCTPWRGKEKDEEK